MWIKKQKKIYIVEKKKNQRDNFVAITITSSEYEPGYLYLELFIEYENTHNKETKRKDTVY